MAELDDERGGEAGRIAEELNGGFQRRSAALQGGGGERAGAGRQAASFTAAQPRAHARTPRDLVNGLF
jgi:hypothetical protein